MSSYDRSSVLLGVALLQITESNGTCYSFRALLVIRPLNDLYRNVWRAYSPLKPDVKLSSSVVSLRHHPDLANALISRWCILSGKQVAAPNTLHILDKISVSLLSTQLFSLLLSKVIIFS